MQSEDRAQGTLLSITFHFDPDTLPLQWFRYAFLRGPFICLSQSESNYPGDLGSGVKAQISKQYVTLP